MKAEFEKPSHQLVLSLPILTVHRAQGVRQNGQWTLRTGVVREMRQVGEEQGDLSCILNSSGENELFQKFHKEIKSFPE